MLMPGTDEEVALERAERIRDRVAGLELMYEGQSFGQVTVSVGVAVYPNHGPVQALITTADAALLRAKEAGRNRVVVAAKRAM
jgi:diguanylate cyclase (GGDEF)-like protein